MGLFVSKLLALKSPSVRGQDSEKEGARRNLGDHAGSSSPSFDR